MASVKLSWKPWHEVVKLRDDLRSGELSLNMFAADLYDVVMGTARPVYQQPKEFFALTYPTRNLQELAKDVMLRLAGKCDKAVRQLQLTYGGGKTHTLITLFHLANEPKKLPDLPAVHELVERIGSTPPQARIAAVAFDRLDPETGMEVVAPNGERRKLLLPWSVMAYQLAGKSGLKILGSETKERDTPPFTNVLEELFRFPQKEGLSTLILLDEVLMWARTKAGEDEAWRHKLQDFFQCMTQAAVKVDRAAIVASLLATDPRKSDKLGKEITQELYSVFRREQEEGVQPVVKEDVAEVLRRRFFKPESAKDKERFRPHVVAAIKGVADLDDVTKKDARGAEERFLQSYPFHPDLTDVLYSKWTNLEGFQRTRGILRTFAQALRDSESWDTGPLVGTNVFLTPPGSLGVAEAARELTTVAATEEYEGKKQEWTAILEGELTKAREIQNDTASLRCREIEQAVFATFLHSQPIGQKALTRELLLLLGPTRPDKIELEKSLRRWSELSWFLDEGAINDADVLMGGQKALPKSWRLGSRPNLRQMHFDACSRVTPDLVEAKLLDSIQNCKPLTSGANAAGARVHNLPERPSAVDDDGDFRYVVLGPKAASESGKPSTEARRFIDETTAADRPRVHRNAIVLAVPAKDGLEVARTAIRDYLGWEEVRSQLKGPDIDPIRLETLSASLESARKRIPDSIQQAYCIVVTVSEKNEVHAFKLTPGGQSLFAVIKSDAKSRIQDTAISAEALLPGGPYDLWKEGETARYVRDLTSAFARFPHLPKMLSLRAIAETIRLGCLEGQFVLRAMRPDKSVRTFWRQEVDDTDLKDPSLEVVLPEAATLTEISATLLVPDALPGLWNSTELSVGKVREYFQGGRPVKVQKDGYDEPVIIPKADATVLDAALAAAVKSGRVWIISGGASLLAEDVPAGLITEQATLRRPPQPISPSELLPENLPTAWTGDVITAQQIAAALSAKAGVPLPWSIVRDAIDGAFRTRLLERSIDSNAWPCDFGSAGAVKIKVPSAAHTPTPTQAPKLPGVFMAEADLRPNQIQDLADQLGELTKATVGLELKFKLRIEIGGKSRAADGVVKGVNAILSEISPELALR